MTHALSYWITKATDTHKEYVLLIAFTTRFSVTFIRTLPLLLMLHTEITAVFLTSTRNTSALRVHNVQRSVATPNLVLHKGFYCTTFAADVSCFNVNLQYLTDGLKLEFNYIRLHPHRCRRTVRITFTSPLLSPITRWRPGLSHRIV